MGTRKKKRNVLCALLMAGAAVFIGGWSPAVGAVQAPGAKPQMYRDAETEPVVLEPVDKTKGVTYVLDEKGTVQAINLNGNSVVVEAAEVEDDTTKYCRIYIDKNSNGLVDAGETAVKLADLSSESGELTEYIQAGLEIWGVYEAKTTEPIVITYNAEGGSRIAGVYKGEAGNITIKNTGSLGAIYTSWESCAGDISVVNSGSLSVIYGAYKGERAGNISITNTAAATVSGAVYGADTCGSIGAVKLDNSGIVSGAIYGENNSKVTGDIEITNTKAGTSTSTIFGACTNSVTGDITIVNQGNGGTYCYGSAGAAVTGDITITNTNTSIGYTYGMNGSSVTGNIDIQIDKNTDNRTNGYVYGVLSGEVKGKVTISADGAKIGGVYGVSGGLVEPAKGEVPLTVKLTDTNVMGYFYAVNAGSYATKIVGDVVVDVQCSQLPDSSSGYWYMIYGYALVEGNVTASLKNIYASCLYGVYGNYNNPAEVAGSVDIDLQGCQFSSSYGYCCEYSVIEKDFKMQGDAATYMRYFQLGYDATVKGDMSVSLYGYDKATSKAAYPTEISGMNRKASDQDYSVGGNMTLRLLGGSFGRVQALQSSSAVKGDVIVDMQGICIPSGYSYVLDSASVEGNVTVTTDTECSLSGSLYCVNNSKVDGNVKVDIVSTSTLADYTGSYTYLYGVYQGSVGGKVDVHLKGGAWYYAYGVYGYYNYNSSEASVAGDVKVVIEDIEMAGGGSCYGVNNGRYAGAVDVDIKNIKGSSAGYVYGVNYVEGQQPITVAMSNIKDVGQSYGLYGNSSVPCKGKVTVTVSDVDAKGYAYGVSSLNAENDVDVTMTNVETNNFFAVEGQTKAKTLTLKVEDCNGLTYSGIGSCNVESLKAEVVNCTFKGLSNLSCTIKEDSVLSFTGGTYESYGSFVNVTSDKNVQMQCTMTDATLTAPASSTNWTLSNMAQGNVTLKMTVDDTCTCTLPASYSVQANSYGNAPAMIYLQGGYYYSGTYPLTAQLLSGVEKLGLYNFQGKLPTLTVKDMDIRNSSVEVPEGVTVTASNGFTMGGTLSGQKVIENIILLEGTLAGPYVANTCNYTYFYMLSGGEISDAGFNQMALKYYPVTLEYNAEEITITESNLGSIELRPELVFARSNDTAKIGCVPKTGFNLGEGTYQPEGDTTASQMNKVVGDVTTYSFDMKETPVTVKIACAGNKISVGKSVADPVAIVNREYTSEEPLYDFATLMIYNDAAEGSLGYALAEGQALPEGLSLTDDGKLIGTPTTVNGDGAEVTFVVTGRNGTTAELMLNIIVSADENASQTNQDGRILVDKVEGTINCLGSSVLIEKNGNATAIYIDDNRDGVADYKEPAVEGDFSKYTLYGLKDYDSQRPLQIIMKGGTLNSLYGAYNCNVTTEPEADSVYIAVQDGSVQTLYGAYTAKIAGGIHVERTSGTVNSLNTCDSSTTYQYTWLNQNGSVTVAGDCILTEDVEVKNLTISAATSQKNYSLTVNSGVTLTVLGNIYQWQYTNLYNKGTVKTETYSHRYTSSAHFVAEGAKLLPENNTFSYIYYPMTISCENLPKNAEAPRFDEYAKTYEDVVYGSPSTSTYFYYTRVVGYTTYYRLNDGEETVLGTIPAGAETYNKNVYGERKPTDIHVFYVPNEIAAKVRFSVPTAEVDAVYDAENPLYDCAASIEISNDTDSEHGEDMLYQIKKGSSLPAGLRLEKDGKIVGTPTKATDGAVPVTVMITGRNGMVAEASLEVSVAAKPEPVKDINTMISLSGSTLDLKGTSVVIFADASSSSYCNIYLDENHDGIADNDKPFTGNGSSAKLSLSNATIYGWKDTDAAYDGDITIYACGGTVGSIYGVYGSSSSQIAEVNGKVSLYMQGTRVNNYTAAGYRASAKELNLYCTAGTLYRNVYGAYEPASVETVHFAFTKDALFYGYSGSQYYMAVTEGGTVGNVYAQVGAAGTSYGFSNYGRFYGVYNTKVSGNVNYSIQGNWRPYYDNHFAQNATIEGDMDIDWQNGYVTTSNSSTSYRACAYNSVMRNLTVNVAADAVMSSTSAIYPYYGGTIQNVYMYVPDTVSSVVDTALVPSSTSVFPVKRGYLYNRGDVYLSGEHTLTEDINVKTLTIHSNGKLVIPEQMALTTSSRVDCYGTIENEGTLTANTTNGFYVYEGASIVNEGTWTSSGGTVFCYGAIENKGTWNAKSTVQLQQNTNAAISNSGQWTVEKPVYLYQGAVISNKNLWNVKADSGVYLNGAAARVTNEGEWNTDGQVSLNNYLNMVVENSGTWNMNRSVYIYQGKVENSGTFNGKYYSTSSNGCVYVVSAGKVVNTGNWMGNAYIYLNGGIMDNAGSLEINPRSTTDTTNPNLYISSANSMLINREDAVLKLMARVDNRYGKIVNYGTVKQTYESTAANMNLGTVYAAKPVTLAGDIANYTSTNFYYPATVDYPEAAVSGATLATTYSSGVEGDENQYLKAKDKFTVTLAGYVGDYTKADVQSVVYGSAETEAVGTNTENQWQGTMPQESITVKVNIVKNDASQIEIEPGEVTIEKLTVNQRNNSIYDLKNLAITNDDGTEGQVSYAVSSTKPLPEGLTLSNGVISGTPKYASSEPYTAEIIVTGKNLTTAVLKLTFTQIEKAVPSLTVPTLYGYTNYKLSQVSLPRPSTGTYSWPDATLDITEKCIAGEKFDLYFTPVDTDNYDWSKVNISAGTWNEEEKRLECQVSITMYTISPSYTVPTDLTAVYGQTLADVKLPSDENGAFVWRSPSTSVGNVGNKSFYASYVPTDTKRYSTVNLYITVAVQPKEVTAKIPTGLKTYRDNTIGQVELPQAEGGTYKWLTAASTPVKENTSYKAVFIPDDNTNYKWVVGDGLTYSEAYKGYVFEVKIEVLWHAEGVHTYETKYDGAYHWKECICGEIQDKAKHTLSEDLVNNGDTHIAACTFDGCEYQKEESHSYEKKVGETEHWYECACHDIINRATHYYSRTVYNETEHWSECSCGKQRDITEHAYNTKKSDSSSHWNQCSCGAKTDIETHKFETLKHDDNNHWYECKCGVKNNVAAHAYGKWLCDEEADNHYALCDCGAQITAAHKYGDCVSTGKSQHKETCEDCGTEIVEDHTWDAGVVTVSPTELKTGLKLYTCIACGEKKEEVLPKNEPPHTNKNHIQAYDESEHWDVCDDGDGYEFVETRASHTFTDWQIDDKTGMHWKECTVCGYKKQLGAHTWKTVYNAENHWQECGVCGLKKSTEAHSYVKRTDEVNHWKECSCGRRIEIEQHSYRSYSYDANGHWDECSCGKRANEAAHSHGKWLPTEDGSKHYHECICGHKEEAEHSAGYVWTSDGETTHTGRCEQCGGNSKTEQHVWDAGRVTKNPTVTEDGVRTKTCTTCKATKTETIDKLPAGHTHSWSADWASDASEHWKACSCGDEDARAAHKWNAGTVTLEPTETETGIKTYRCTVCGREKNEELPKLAHEHKYSETYTYDDTYHWRACSCGRVTARALHQWDKGTVLKPATMEETGVMQYQCTVCGAVKQTVLPKLTEAHEHSFSDWTASDDIYHTRICSCGSQETRGHSFSYWTKDDAKNHKKTCRVCGHVIYEAHAWDAGKITKEAGKNEGWKEGDELNDDILGEVTYTCLTCGETRIETYTLGDHIHSYGDASMRNEDVHMRMCQDAACGHMLLENHIWDDGKVTAAATETKAGTMTYTCKECSYKRTEAIEKHAHECDEWEAAEDGVHHTGACIYGDKEMTEEHTWNDGVITLPATAAATGAKLYTCTKCGAEKTEVIPKHEHTYGNWVADGDKNHKKICECGETVSAPHDWDAGYITKPATTTEEGEITYTCEDCGGTRVSPLAKVPENHKHKYVWVRKNADIHVEMCNGCGLPTGKQAPHTWDAGEVTVEPTEAAEGVRTYHCTVCDAKKKEAIAKLGHTYGEWIKNDKDTHKKVCACGDVVTEAHSWNTGEVTTEPTAQAEGVKTYTCTVCGETKTEAIAKLPPEEPDEPDEPEPKEVGAEFVDEQSKAKFTVVDPASIDSEDEDDSPAVIYTASVDANAQEIIIPDTITVDGVEYRVISIADGAFKNNKKLKKITIGNCVRTIGNSAFEGCTSLKTVTFKKTSRVKTIGKKAFYKCTALTKITIPKSVVTIKESAFDGCKKLATVTFQSGSKLKTLGKKVFNNCVALKKITIPKNVTTIGSSAFSGCKKLATVTFQSGSKLKKIDSKAFNGCVVLKKITIPKNVTTIGSSAFNKCKKLGTITIQSTKLNKVGKNAFKGIKSTATIKVPSKKLTAYKKLLKNKGQGKKVKIKKI